MKNNSAEPIGSALAGACERLLKISFGYLHQVGLLYS